MPSPDPAAISLDRAIDTLQRLYPSSALYALHDPQDGDFLAWCAQHDLPAELRHSAAKRQHEFLAGRYAAAKTLQQLGVPDLRQLGRQPNGQAAWPAGYTGSISHHHGIALAWVAPCTAHTQLGVDLEAVISAERANKLHGRVLHHAEMQLGQQLSQQLGQQGGFQSALWFTLLFSAKETVYKLLSSQARRVMPFSSVQIVNAQSESGAPDAMWSADALRLTCRLTENWSAEWPRDRLLSVSALLLPDAIQPRWVLSYAALPVMPTDVSSTDRA